MPYRASYQKKFSKVVGLQKGKYYGQGVLTLNRMYIGKRLKVTKPDGETVEVLVGSRKKAWRKEGGKRPEQGILHFHHSWVGLELQIEVIDE